MGKVKFKTLLKGFAHRQVQNMGHLRTESDFVQGTNPMLLRLAIPRFWSNARAPWKTGFSHQVTSWACSKFFNKELHFWAPLWRHLMGKTSFPWSARIGPKPGNSQPWARLGSPVLMTKTIRSLFTIPCPDQHLIVRGVHHRQCDQIGRFLYFGQPFKAGGNNYFTQIAHIVRQFL